MSSPTTFKFDEKLTQTLDDLKALTGSASKVEVIRRAIATFKFLEEAKGKGETLILRNEQQATEREIVMP